MLTSVVLFTVIGGLWVAGYFNIQGASIPAEGLAIGLQKLPVIDGNTISSFNAAPGAASINTAIREMNSRLGTSFGPVNASAILVAEFFIPVLQPYNNLIIAADHFNKSSKGSVEAIYEDSFILAATAILCNAAYAYHLSYNTVGIMNDMLKIGKIQKFCAECYSIVLATLYELISNGLPFLLSQFMSEFPTAPKA